MFSEIRYSGINYPVRTLLWNGMRVNVSTISLENALLSNHAAEYADDKARLIDDQIIFYVEDDEISLPDESLSCILNQEILS